MGSGGSEGTSILVMSLGWCWGLEHGLQRGQGWASFSTSYCLTIQDGAKLSPPFCLGGMTPSVIYIRSVLKRLILSFRVWILISGK